MTKMWEAISAKTFRDFTLNTVNEVGMFVHLRQVKVILLLFFQVLDVLFALCVGAVLHHSNSSQ